ncbi:glycosyltransferase [Sphingobacterium suaedae]|uniref:Glycosyltransferase n=1 Tax=Sphingobacterium suaedae TaxID=1686402 RepID=A0ABW5KKI9_9SPHI
MAQLEHVFPYFLQYSPLGVLGVLLLAQLYYIYFVYGKLATYRVATYQQSVQPPVSIIICAHNEQENLKTFLPSVLNQHYPTFEIILVDDCSNDDTPWILKEFALTYPDKLRIVEIKEHIRLKNTKKFAVTMGIKAAKHEHLVFTDADCQPVGDNWLTEMAGAFSDDKEIILGYSPYFKTKGFLNKLIRFETSHTAMSYLAYALKKNAYMGVGRNLAYTRSLFFKGKGFNKHMHIKSGDDDLFVNHNATKDNVRIAIHPDSHVYSQPKTTWKSYYKQKARHAGASVLYKNRHKRTLASQLISSVLFYIILIICAALYPELWFVILAIYAVRLVSQFIVFSKIYRKLAVRDLLLWLPLLDLFYYFYICFNGILNRRKQQRSWK